MTASPQTPRVLLVGRDWFAGVTEFCRRGLEELGVETRVVGTNVPAQSQRVTKQQAKLRQLRLVGHPLANRYWDREEARRHADFQARLRTTVAEFRPDLLLTLMIWGDEVGERALEGVSALKVGWLLDDPFLNKAELAPTLPFYDRIFSADEAWGIPARFLTRADIPTLPCGADLASHRPLETASVREGLVFVGSSYAGKAAGIPRRALLEGISDLPLRVYGDKGWRSSARLARCFAGRELPMDEANAVYNGASAAINIHHPQWKSGTSLRTFGLCASGVAQLVDYRPGLERYFDLDREVAAFRNAEELRAQAERVLRDATWRDSLAREGLSRVRAEHTYAHRLRVILRDAGFESAL